MHWEKVLSRDREGTYDPNTKISQTRKLADCLEDVTSRILYFSQGTLLNNTSHLFNVDERSASEHKEL